MRRTNPAIGDLNHTVTATVISLYYLNQEFQLILPATCLLKSVSLISKHDSGGFSVTSVITLSLHTTICVSVGLCFCLLC